MPTSMGTDHSVKTWSSWKDEATRSIGNSTLEKLPIDAPSSKPDFGSLDIGRYFRRL